MHSGKWTLQNYGELQERTTTAKILWEITEMFQTRNHLWKCECSECCEYSENIQAPAIITKIPETNPPILENRETGRARDSWFQNCSATGQEVFSFFDSGVYRRVISCD